MQKMFQRASKTLSIKWKEISRTVSLLVSLVRFKPKRWLLQKTMLFSVYMHVKLESDGNQ